MQKVRVPVNSFQFGEVSPSVLMRTDTPIYQSSAQRIENMIVRAEGGVKRRFGLKALDHVEIEYDSSKRMQMKLFHFIFDDDERYIIGISDLTVTAWRVTDTGVTFLQTITQDVDTNALPFDVDYLHEYTHSQYGDVLFICHPLFVPRMITRTSLTTFTVDTFSFDQSVDGGHIFQPYAKFAASDVTLTPSAASHAAAATITITTSSDYFDTTGTQTGSDYLSSLHVGTVLTIGDSEFQIASVQSATQATGSIITTYYDGTATVYEIRTRLSILNPLRTREGVNEIEVTHLGHGLNVGASITVSSASATGGIIASNINGARTIKEVIDENTYVIEGAATATDSEDGGGLVYVASAAATLDWSEQSFSAKRGYPAAVTFHENRLVFGGTLAQPDTMWSSKLGQYFNFDAGTGADNDAITITAATGEVNEIRYLKSARDLQIFTASSELYTPTFLNQAITPTNAQVRQQTPYGITFVEPQSIDGATIFVQTGGKVIREYLYTDAEEAYTSTAVSTIASHLLDDPKDSAVVHGAFGEAESYAIFVMDDGDAILFGSNRAEKRAGWTRLTSGSDTYGIHSCVAIDDRMFCLAWEHCTNTSDVAKDWLVLTEFTQDYLLDFSTYGEDTAGYMHPTVTQLFRDTELLDVIGYTSEGAEPVYIGQLPIESYDTGGSVYATRVDVSAYTATYTHFEIGKSFDVLLTGNPVDVNTGVGFVTGHKRSINAAILDLIEARSVAVNGTAYNPSAAYSGKKEIFIFGYNRDPQVVITQPQPLPLQINGYVAELIV